VRFAWQPMNMTLWQRGAKHGQQEVVDSSSSSYGNAVRVVATY
jgi:hypothetical protein